MHARYVLFASNGFKVLCQISARAMDRTPAPPAAGDTHAPGCGQHSRHRLKVGGGLQRPPLPSSVTPSIFLLEEMTCSAAAMRRFSHYLTAVTEERVNFTEVRHITAFPDKGSKRVVMDSHLIALRSLVIHWMVERVRKSGLRF